MHATPTTRTLCATSIAAAILLTSALASAQTLNLWTREAGDYANSRGPAHGQSKMVALPTVATQTVTREDVQYGDKKTFKGVSFARLVRAYKPASGHDMALLHFKNRMVVPVPLDVTTLNKLDLFVATHVKDGKSWADHFPSVVKESNWGLVSKRLEFDGNKIVIGTNWHPMLADDGDESFSPWQYVDTLTGVEFVKSKAYFGQFDVAPPDAKAGVKTFKARCQFCHSVQKVGSRRGWDFVEPVAISEWKSPKVLYYHVRFRDPDEVEKGAKMPAQADVTPDEIDNLWKWINAISEGEVKPYKP